ncbi:hypothetical protein [Streptomyces sp. NPDC020951]|uniref:hypothetical protein n=1 Tax=Streptomyces sp. NPDC020951 TaxID=3365104 RepID=UPI0037A3644C
MVLATEWPEYRNVDPTTLTGRTAEALMVDCRTPPSTPPAGAQPAGRCTRSVGPKSSTGTADKGDPDNDPKENPVDLLKNGTMFDVVDALSGVCASANMDLSRDELLALQVAKPAEEAGEALHALQGTMGLMPRCAETCNSRGEHTWGGVSNDCVGAFFASLIALKYIEPEEWRTILVTGVRQRLTEIGSPLADTFTGEPHMLDAAEELAKSYTASAGQVTEQELPTLAVGNLAREAGEAIHALHGIKGLLTRDEECGPQTHSWIGVQHHLVGSCLTALVALSVIDPAGWRETFAEISFRRPRRGREAMAA